MVEIHFTELELFSVGVEYLCVFLSQEVVGVGGVLELFGGFGIKVLMGEMHKRISFGFIIKCKNNKKY